MRMHRAAEDLLIAGLPDLFSLLTFPRAKLFPSSQTLARVFSRWRNCGPHHTVGKTYSFFLHDKRIDTPVKSSLRLWAQVVDFLHVGM